MLSYPLSFYRHAHYQIPKGLLSKRRLATHNRLTIFVSLRMLPGDISYLDSIVFLLVLIVVFCRSSDCRPPWPRPRSSRGTHSDREVSQLFPHSRLDFACCETIANFISVWSSKSHTLQYIAGSEIVVRFVWLLLLGWGPLWTMLLPSLETLHDCLALVFRLRLDYGCRLCQLVGLGAVLPLPLIFGTLSAHRANWLRGSDRSRFRYSQTLSPKASSRPFTNIKFTLFSSYTVLHQRSLVYNFSANSVGATTGCSSKFSRNMTTWAVSTSYAYVTGRKVITSIYEDNLSPCTPEFGFLQDRWADRDDDADFLMKLGMSQTATSLYALILSQASLHSSEKGSIKVDSLSSISVFSSSERRLLTSLATFDAACPSKRLDFFLNLYLQQSWYLKKAFTAGLIAASTGAFSLSALNELDFFNLNNGIDLIESSDSLHHIKLLGDASSHIFRIFILAGLASASLSPQSSPRTIGLMMAVEARSLPQ